MRRPIGIAAFVLAIAVLIVLFFALRQGIGIRIPLTAVSNWPHVAISAPGHVARGSDSRSAQGIREVVVAAPSVGDVQLTATTSSDVAWTWSVTGPRHGALQSAESGGVLTLTFRPALPLAWTFGAMPDKLQVQLPAGLTANVSVATGSAEISGAFRSLSANVTTGALAIRNFSGRLRATVVTGPLDVQAVQVAGPLSLQVDTGPLTFSGDPGLSSSFSVGTGPLTLSLAPRGTLAVQAGAHLGPMSSGFPGLPGGANGVFSGTIGQGPRGTLMVDDATGPVSIMPQ